MDSISFSRSESEPEPWSLKGEISPLAPFSKLVTTFLDFLSFLEDDLACFPFFLLAALYLSFAMSRRLFLIVSVYLVLDSKYSIFS